MTLQELVTHLEHRGGIKPTQPLTPQHVTALIVELDDLRRDMRYTAGQAKRNP
jgi:hypothetical protein